MFGLTNTDDARDWSDEEVLMRSQSAPWLFALLLERYQDAFLRKARSIVSNELDAEEIVQDTFTKIYMNAARFEVQEGAKFSSWAYKILMNTAFTRYQKCKKEHERTVYAAEEFWELQKSTGEHVGLSEDRDAVERVLGMLPGHFATVLRLHYLERWSHKDIAAETGETVGAIKARIHRAKEAFRKKGAERGMSLL